MDRATLIFVTAVLSIVALFFGYLVGTNKPASESPLVSTASTSATPALPSVAEGSTLESDFTNLTSCPAFYNNQPKILRNEEERARYEAVRAKNMDFITKNCPETEIVH